MSAPFRDDMIMNVWKNMSNASQIPKHHAFGLKLSDVIVLDMIYRKIEKPRYPFHFMGANQTIKKPSTDQHK